MTEPDGTPLYSPFVRGKRNIPLLTKEGIGEVLFGLMWRLAILLLPWQARWFSDATLAGWPWEQGRISFYASWIPMIVVIVMHVLNACRLDRSASEVERPIKDVLLIDPSTSLRFARGDKRAYAFVCIGVLLTISVLNILRDHDALRPILQWWVQVSVPALFILALRKTNISKRSIATWFAISLVPHAFLGLWQFASQQVIGSKWVGIATQLPQMLGVSVIAHDGLRILRAYGGFPHPNIFGAWLAIGLLLAIWLAATSSERRVQWIWTLIASLFASVLVLTFSRGAWLAASVGFIALLIPLLTKSLPRACRGEGRGEVPTDRPTGTPSSSPRKGAWPPRGFTPFVRGRILIFLFPIIILSFVIFSQRQHLFARFDLSQRLEQKSVDQRVGSLRTGWDLFLKHPLIGSGPNAELLAVASTNQKLNAPLEPPHNAYLLALDDFGAIGFVAIIVIVVGARFPRPVRSEGGETPPLRSLFAILFILAFFDHYLWSTWSGQALIATAILLIIEPKTNP